MMASGPSTCLTFLILAPIRCVISRSRSYPTKSSRRVVVRRYCSGEEKTVGIFGNRIFKTGNRRPINFSYCNGYTYTFMANHQETAGLSSWRSKEGTERNRYTNDNGGLISQFQVNPALSLKRMPASSIALSNMIMG